jgi:hypothetical protein
LKDDIHRLFDDGVVVSGEVGKPLSALLVFDDRLDLTPLGQDSGGWNPLLEAIRPALQVPYKTDACASCH